MKILITGATGLVGREIVAVCKHRKIAVHYLTTRKEKIVTTAEYTGFYWNPALGEIDLNCFEGVDAIINLAGVPISGRWTKAYKNKILRSRVDSLRTLRQGLSQIGVHQVHSLISASAIGIYPDSPSNYYKEEETRVDDSFIGQVVYQWEQEADLFQAQGLEVAKLRIGLVLSGKGGALPKMAAPVRYYLGAAFGSGKQWQSWIHVHDLAHIFLYVAEEELTGVFNAVAPNPISHAKLIREIGKSLERPLFLPNIPQTVMKMILGEMSYLLFSSQRVSSKKIQETGYDFLYPNIYRALSHIYKEQEAYVPEVLYRNELAR